MIALPSGLGFGRRFEVMETAPTPKRAETGSTRRDFFSNSASVTFPGSRSRMDGAGGLQRPGGAPCCSRAQAVRGRSTHLHTTAHLRLSPLASTGTSRGVPASPSHPIWPAREAGLKEEN
ncbi:MAG: hypothetical protein JWM24_2172 [Solirubrobacterales bacterium]|nr:hypothetical protein [Solirubrobacterales bacterium]